MRIKRRNVESKKKPISEIKGKSIVKDKKEQVENGCMENRPSTITKGEVRLGLNKGVTLSIGDYEFMRVSAWIERVVDDNERERNSNMNDMSDYLDEFLNAQIEDIRNANNK